ncbi:MAG: VOC family protein [Acidimicrobiia bacterium]
MGEPSRPSIDQSIVFTYTDDLEAGSRFFSDILELELVVDQGACHIYRLTDTSFIGVCNLPDRPKNKAAVTITLVSDDVDEWHRYLTAKGIEYVNRPRHSPEFGVYSSLFISPDGYRIEIQHFDDKSWRHGPGQRDSS